MAVGTGLAVAGLVNAGMQLFGAHKASSAAKDAAKIQSAAADKALGVSRDVYDRQMSGMDPYANVGRQSMNVLGRLTSPGQPYTSQLQRQDARQGYTNYGGGQPAPQTIGGTTGQRPRGQAPAQGAAQMPYRGGGGQAAPMPYGGGAPRMVLMQAPDGSQRQIPEDQAQSFVARGAQIL